MKPEEQPAPVEAAKVGELIALLQLAYSAELAAAGAYHGHAASVSDPLERTRIREIEAEELEHRRLIGIMLKILDSGPSPTRERRARLIGATLGALCHVSGWLAPMYGAGRLESRNIIEYETAARLAWASGRRAWVDCLLAMAEVEWEHEAYFRERVCSRRAGSWIRLWPRPSPKATIRSSFEDETGMRTVPDAPLPATLPR